MTHKSDWLTLFTPFTDGAVPDDGGDRANFIAFQVFSRPLYSECYRAYKRCSDVNNYKNADINTTSQRFFAVIQLGIVMTTAVYVLMVWWTLKQATSPHSVLFREKPHLQ